MTSANGVPFGIQICLADGASSPYLGDHARGDPQGDAGSMPFLAAAVAPRISGLCVRVGGFMSMCSEGGLWI